MYVILAKLSTFLHPPEVVWENFGQIWSRSHQLTLFNVSQIWNIPISFYSPIVHWCNIHLVDEFIPFIKIKIKYFYFLHLKYLKANNIVQCSVTKNKHSEMGAEQKLRLVCNFCNAILPAKKEASKDTTFI